MLGLFFIGSKYYKLACIKLLIVKKPVQQQDISSLCVGITALVSMQC